jgi:hypothetical protein
VFCGQCLCSALQSGVPRRAFQLFGAVQERPGGGQPEAGPPAAAAGAPAVAEEAVQLGEWPGGWRVPCCNPKAKTPA